MKQMVDKPVPKTRRPGSKGYPCGEETRTALLDCGLQLFGSRGYDGASTREIAAAAGTTTPALQYYFMNKQGLYLACINRIAELFWMHMKEPIDTAKRVLATGPTDAALIDAYVAIQTRLAEHMFSSEYAGSSILIGSQQEAGLGPDVGFKEIYEVVHVPMSDASCAIIGRLTGRSPKDPETVMRYLALHGQSLVFLQLRRSALQLLGRQRYEEDHVVSLLSMIGSLTRCCLEEMVKLRPVHIRSLKSRVRARPLVNRHKK